MPFRLSRTPAASWAEHFVRVWNHPPRYTNMHRPGIGSVRGDRIVLDGTTLAEVQRYHRDTLRLVVETVNGIVAGEEEEARRRAAAAARAEEDHRSTVERLARGITFD